MVKKTYLAGFLVLLFQTVPAYSATVSFSGLNGTHTDPFVISDMGINFTFGNPSTDSVFTVANDSLVFGVRPGGQNALNLVMFTLEVSQSVILNNYTVDNNETQNGGTFDIDLLDNPNPSILLVDGADGAAPFGIKPFVTVSTDPLELIAGETYKFTYNPANPTSSTTGLAEFNYSPVPIPAAAWLLGSALLGLAGFKRSKSKA